MPAYAQDIEEAASPPFKANIGVVSDYRFRGISQTTRDPAVQGGIDLSSDRGVGVGVWASNVSGMGGADAEVDIYGSYSGTAAGLDYTLTAIGYAYPGGSGLNYGEIIGVVSRTIGPVEISGTVGYTPNQKNTYGDDLYLKASTSLAIPATALSLRAGLGYEDGFYDGKWDWELGLTYDFSPLSVSVGYIDTVRGASGKAGKAAVVAGISAAF